MHERISIRSESRLRMHCLASALIAVASILPGVAEAARLRPNAPVLSGVAISPPQVRLTWTAPGPSAIASVVNSASGASPAGAVASSCTSACTSLCPAPRPSSRCRVWLPWATDVSWPSITSASAQRPGAPVTRSAGSPSR